MPCRIMNLFVLLVLCVPCTHHSACLSPKQDRVVVFSSTNMCLQEASNEDMPAVQRFFDGPCLPFDNSFARSLQKRHLTGVVPKPSAGSLPCRIMKLTALLARYERHTHHSVCIYLSVTSDSAWAPRCCNRAAVFRSHCRPMSNAASPSKGMKQLAYTH